MPCQLAQEVCSTCTCHSRCSLVRGVDRLHGWFASATSRSVETRFGSVNKVLCRKRLLLWSSFRVAAVSLPCTASPARRVLRGLLSSLQPLVRRSGLSIHVTRFVVGWKVRRKWGKSAVDAHQKLAAWPAEIGCPRFDLISSTRLVGFPRLPPNFWCAIGALLS